LRGGICSRFFEHAAGMVVLAEGVQAGGQGAGGCLGIRVVRAESVAVKVVGVFGQGEGRPWFAAGQEEACAVVEQPRHLGGD
jgi:hypothetical protein